MDTLAIADQDITRLCPACQQKYRVNQSQLVCDPRHKKASWRGQPLKLTETEFKILSHLSRHSGAYTDYRGLYDLVHHPGFHAGPGKDGYKSNMRGIIKRLRGKFRAVDSDFASIQNFSGFGYAWQE